MKAVWDDFFRFLAPFWEAFGRQNREKRLSEIRWKMDAIFGVLLGLNPAESGRVGGRAGGHGAYFLARIWQELRQSLEHAVLPAFGRGRRI